MIKVVIRRLLASKVARLFINTFAKSSNTTLDGRNLLQKICSFTDIMLVLKVIIINALAVLALVAYFNDRYSDVLYLI